MKTDDIALGEKFLAALGDIETSRFGAAGGSFAPPTYDTRAECFAHARHDATDFSVSVDAKRLAVHADAERRLPMALFEPLYFDRYISERAKYQSPSQLYGHI